jgi:NADH dehydrogenase
MSKRIVIVGGGFTGAYCAQAFERTRPARSVEIVLLDRHNYLVFTPLLVEAGTGGLEPRHTVVPIRSFLKSGSFRMSEVIGADFEARTVTYRVPLGSEARSLSYDHLVLAPGSVTLLPEVPGLREFGRGMKSMNDAVGLRDRAVALLEAADVEPDPDRRRALLHFVVVGSNYTGVEVAGEYHMFLSKAAKLYKNLDPRDVQVTIVEIADRILPALDTDLAAYAQRSLEARGVRVRLESTVREIREMEVLLDSGEPLPASTVIWCAGIAPSPLVAKLNVPMDERGYILCESDFRVRGFENVWSAGDVAVNPDREGNAYPATAQHAVRQAEHLAKNLAQVLEGKPTIRLDYRPIGSLVTLGCRSGVAKIFGIKLAGFAAWWMHRTVYLMKMPGLPRKARLTLDWTTDLLFPKDVVQLGVHREEEME